ncbi:hypothetical protein [Mycolicibacterium fortuitum]|uniref:hypothetical protein n=1 Tax=Mycolicibacterium fortuitum TaxID=1766 RepID=UPI00262A1AAB|nr:hypothetical protein [Mycolicibacterium fortuitum]
MFHPGEHVRYFWTNGGIFLVSHGNTPYSGVPGGGGSLSPSWCRLRQADSSQMLVADGDPPMRIAFCSNLHMAGVGSDYFCPACLGAV